MSKYAFGVDVGGTTCKLGLFEHDGKLLDKWEIPTNTENCGASILEDIACAIERKLKDKGLSREAVLGVGLDVPVKVGNGAAGEIGHPKMRDDEQEPCGCGGYGCLERYASAIGIVRLARGRLERDPAPTVLRNLPKLGNDAGIYGCVKLLLGT